MRTGKLSEVDSVFVKYLDQRTCHSARQDWTPGSSSSAFLSRRLDSSKNLYQKDLYAHYGCVNAIEFSNEGDLLVSGGDDRRVLLWNIDGVLSEKQTPHAMKGEHNSNIFCLSFDSFNSKIFSAGNDEQVIVHDLKTGDLVDVFLHREAVYGVSVNPTLDSVFASAGEDGQILMYDMRESPASDPMCLARYHDAFHSVQFHPLEPTFIVTANSREGVALWDVRKPKMPVIRYGEKRCAQSSMCAKFNRTGTQIVALRRRSPPILFNTQRSKPVAEFDAEHYYNSCTMKSCCFAGDNDQFILSGSDDFNLYMWKIPENERYFVSDAHMVLKGHRSIVNQVRFNPQNFIIASSGVEKIVKLWSGVSLPGSKGSLKTRSYGSFMSRRVYTYEEYIGLVMESGQVFGDVNHDYSHGSTDEDTRMMAFFDCLVQRELEGWTSNTDLSDEPGVDIPLSSPDENDTETTQSSIVTSQSDDNDSVDGNDHGKATHSREVNNLRSHQDRRNSRGNHSGASDSQVNSGCVPGESQKEDEDEDEDDANKTPTGSEWIMCLIAKKRAQLRAAKSKRKRKNLKKHRKKRQKYLRSYTTSTRRRYLYHPEGQRANEEDQPNGDSHRLSGMRRLSFRQYMAPYTIMVVDSDLDSDEVGANNDSDSDAEATTFIQTTAETSDSNKRKRQLWSPDTDSSSEDNPSPAKQTHIDFSNSDSDIENETTPIAKNGHIISEIVESNASESEVEISRNGLSSPVLETVEANGGPSSQSVLPCNVSSAGVSNLSINNGNVDKLESNLNTSYMVSEAIPISTISIDDNGSLSFSTENNPLLSSLDIQNNVDVVPSVSMDEMVIQNGSSQNITEVSSLEEGETSVLVSSPADGEKTQNDEVSENGLETSENVNGTGNGSSHKKVCFTFKKRVQSVRNYRKHEEDL